MSTTTDLRTASITLLHDLAEELRTLGADAAGNHFRIVDAGLWAEHYSTYMATGGGHDGYGLVWIDAYKGGLDYVSAEYEGDEEGYTSEVRDDEVLAPEDVARVRAWAETIRNDN